MSRRPAARQVQVVDARGRRPIYSGAALVVVYALGFLAGSIFGAWLW